MGNKILELLKIDGSEMMTAFQKASIQGKGTPQEVADFRENYFNKFISNYFPFPHRVTKGIINDSFGNQSDSIDTILIGPNHPHTIDNTGKFSLVLAEGVDAAIEVKPDISAKTELIRGLKQIESVKKLRRAESPTLLVSNHPEHIREYAKTIPSFIFSIKANSDPINTAKNVVQYYTENSISIENQVDFVIINNVGIIANYKYPELSRHKDKTTGIFYEGWREHTLAAFLLKINESFSGQIRQFMPVLNYYMIDLSPHTFEQIEL